MLTVRWTVATIQWVLYIYLPITVIYATVRMMKERSPFHTLERPFPGLGKVSLRHGCLIWIIQLILLNIELNDLERWMYDGINPFISIW